MFMNPSFWIFPAFKKSREKSPHLGAGVQHRELVEIVSFASVVQNEARGAIKQVQDSAQNAGDSGGTNSSEITTSPFNAAPAALKKEFTAAEKTT